MQNHFSRVQLFVSPWTVVCQAPLSMRFSRQENWTVLPFSSSGYLTDPGIEPTSLLKICHVLVMKIYVNSKDKKKPKCPPIRDYSGKKTGSDSTPDTM